MASASIASYHRTLRRMHLSDLIDRHLDAQVSRPFKASLVVNARTGLPIEPRAKFLVTSPASELFTTPQPCGI